MKGSSSYQIAASQQRCRAWATMSSDILWAKSSRALLAGGGSWKLPSAEPAIPSESLACFRNPSASSVTASSGLSERAPNQHLDLLHPISQRRWWSCWIFSSTSFYWWPSCLQKQSAEQRHVGFKHFQEMFDPTRAVYPFWRKISSPSDLSLSDNSNTRDTGLYETLEKTSLFKRWEISYTVTYKVSVRLWTK